MPQRDPICIREHMPLNHQKYLSYNPEEFAHWAEGIGTHTLKTVNHFLYSEKEPEHGYKYCVGLMKAVEKYGVTRIEKACEKLFTVTLNPSLRSIITILKNGQDKLTMDTPGVQVLREAHHPISSHCAYQEVCLLPSGEVFAVIRKNGSQ